MKRTIPKWRVSVWKRSCTKNYTIFISLWHNGCVAIWEVSMTVEVVSPSRSDANYVKQYKWNSSIKTKTRIKTVSYKRPPAKSRLYRLVMAFPKYDGGCSLGESEEHMSWRQFRCFLRILRLRRAYARGYLNLCIWIAAAMIAISHTKRI